MTNYDKIHKLISHGFKVKCQLEEKEWVIFSSIKNGEKEGLRMSSTSDDIDKCFDTLGIQWEEEEIINTNYNFLSIAPIIEKPKMYEVGDLVDIAEEAGQIQDVSYRDTETMKGYKIIDISDDQNGLTYCLKIEGMTCVWAAHQFLTPHIPGQDDEVAKAIKFLESKGVIKNGLVFTKPQ